MKTHRSLGAWPLAILAAGTLGMMLPASSAAAQDYGYTEYHQYGPPETVEVIAPRHRPHYSRLGAPIEEVSLSRPVRIDDLDLRTPEGRDEAEYRVSFTARQLCRRLDIHYPIATDDSPPCYRAAMADAMDQVDAAADRQDR